MAIWKTIWKEYLTNTKILLILIIVFCREINDDHKLFYQKKDRDFCPTCFTHQVKDCKELFNNIEKFKGPLKSYLQLLPLSSKRHMDFYRFKPDNSKIYAKYFGYHPLMERITKIGLNNSKELEELFFDEERVDGFQFCPKSELKRFMTHLSNGSPDADTETSIWLYMLVNVQLLLLPRLYEHGFPVPKTFGVCGLALHQEYVGHSLVYYYDASPVLRLDIARQLILGALKFSMGLDDFRIYITDLGADNLVYNEVEKKLYFVDLDTVFIVDGKASKFKEEHCHQHIECDNCFAFTPKELCEHRMSDINIFSACHFLRENLQHDVNKGFLSSLPAEIINNFPSLLELLDECVDCPLPYCKNRFEVASDLLVVLEEILAAQS